MLAFKYSNTFIPGQHKTLINYVLTIQQVPLDLLQGFLES